MSDPGKRDRAPAGPVPTLAQLARETSWVWAHCTMTCGHTSAIPLAPIVARLGAHASSDRLRACLRCTKCGKRGGLLKHPSWPGMHERAAPLPFDQVPAGLKRAMADHALAAIGVVR
jgi:hypothetical protein